MDTAYKVYIDNDTVKKTVTVKHPKLDATADDFNSAGNGLASAYNSVYVNTGLASETIVHAAS